MIHARMSTLASLQRTIGNLESGADDLARVALGHAGADAVLQGGLVRGALHEVFAGSGRHGAAASGFIAGLAHRLAGRRPLVWVRQDFAERESGALSMSGLNELGLDPLRLVGFVSGERVGESRCRYGHSQQGRSDQHQGQGPSAHGSLRFRVSAVGDEGILGSE